MPSFVWARQWLCRYPTPVLMWETGEAQPSSSNVPPALNIPGATAEDLEGIDLSVLADLPPDVQLEVVEQQRQERRRRQAANRSQQACRLSF